MTLLRRATDVQQSEWREVPEGVWRWIIGQPELKLSEKFGNYQVCFPLELDDASKKAVDEETADLPKDNEDTKQSYRTFYYCGLSLGYFDRSGTFQTTKLVDFLSAGLGSQNSKKFREWISQGGGPPKAEDPDDQQMELQEIGDWLNWWNGLEVYGTIRHEQDKKDPNKVWARFAGPMAVGSLPGQKDDEYQAHGRGKLRAILAESDAGVKAGGAEPVSVPVVDTARQARREENRRILTEDTENDLPF